MEVTLAGKYRAILVNINSLRSEQSKFLKPCKIFSGLLTLENGGKKHNTRAFD